MEALVLDTNSLIQALPKKSRYHDLWISLFDGRNIMCVSNEILEEYEEILEAKTTRELSSLVVKAIINNPNTHFITPYYNFNLIQTDPDENKLVDCAIAASAKYIVTEDRHFNILNEIDFPKVDIISLDEIMKEL